MAAPFADVVRGRVQYVGSVKGWEDDVYVSLARSLAELHPNFERRATVPQKGGLYVYTEGKTDVTHLARALAHFQDRDELLDLVLEFDDDSAFEGDGALQKHLRRLPATKPSVATVCLFDRDNEKLLREEGLLQDDWVDRGNGVVAAALVVPPFRATAGRLCIEMLYLDDDLRITDADGRRIYLRSEFDERSGHHRTEDCSVANPRNDTLVREDVHQFGTQRSIALSKAAFAEVVEEGRAPFDAVSFDGFRATFEVLRQAALAVAHKVC